MRAIPLLTTLLLTGACRDEPGFDTVRFQVLASSDLVDHTPVGTATVALDAADGGRQEAQADDDGFVAFDLDWSAGPFDITVDPGREDIALHSLLGVTERTLPERVFLEAHRPSIDRLPLNGTVTGRTPDTTLVVTAHWDGGGAAWEGDHDHYYLQVPADVPFALVYVEVETGGWTGTQHFDRAFTNWHRVEHAALSEALDETFALDSPVSPDSATVALEMPEGALRDEGYGYGMVFSARSNFWTQCGWATTGAPGAAGTTFEVDVSWLPPEDVAELGTQVSVSSAEAATFLWAQGTPDQWTEPVELLSPPLLTRRGDALQDPFEFAAVDDGLRAQVRVEDGYGRAVWGAFGAPGMTKLVLPDPPSSVKSDRFADPDLAVSTGLYDGPAPGSSPWYRLSVDAATPLVAD